MTLWDVLRDLAWRTHESLGLQEDKSDRLFDAIGELERAGMSNVRMCDKCSRVFPTTEEGWQHFMGQSFKLDERGKRIAVEVEMDVCSLCIIGPITNVPQITNGPTKEGNL